MDIKPIYTTQDYEDALKYIERIFDAEPGTDDFDKLSVLATLVESYEDKNFPIESPDPIEAIKFRMEQLGISRSDLEKILHYIDQSKIPQKNTSI